MKYTEEQKQKFRDLVAQGKPIKEAAAEAGISLAIGKVIRVQDNRKERESSSPAPAGEPKEKPEEKQEENLSEGDVPPPGSGGGGASAGSGARGAEGARSALKDEDDDPEEDKEEPEQTEEEKKAAEEAAAAEEAKKKNAADPAEVLVNLSEMLCSGMVWLFARRKKVKLTWEQKEELAWSEAERVQLLRHARHAAAVMPGILAMLGPYIGLLFYGFILFKVTESRCEQVAEWGPAAKRRDGDDEEIKDADWEEKKSDLNNPREDW